MAKGRKAPINALEQAQKALKIVEEQRRKRELKNAEHRKAFELKHAAELSKGQTPFISATPKPVRSKKPLATTPELPKSQPANPPARAVTKQLQQQRPTQPTRPMTKTRASVLGKPKNQKSGSPAKQTTKVRSFNTKLYRERTLRGAMQSITEKYAGMTRKQVIALEIQRIKTMENDGSFVQNKKGVINSTLRLLGFRKM